MGWFVVGLVGGGLLGIPYWLVGALLGLGFTIGIARHFLSKRKKRRRELTELYTEGGPYGRRRKLYDR